MGMSINTNVASLTAQRNSGKVQSDLSTAMNRLSSGLRINSAKDDAAGLAISERFTAQIRGLNQAARNANDAISLAQTAEGALSGVGSNLQRIRELSVQSANATNSASDRAALQAEAAQLIAEVQRVGTQTEFNGVKLLDGSFTSKAFQVGANANETITVSSIVDSRTSVLGNHSLTADGSITGNVVTAASGAVTNGVDAAVAGTNFTIGVTVAGVTTSTTPITYAANSGADAIATAINNAAGNLGVTATASNSATLSAISVAGAVTFNLGATAVAATLTDVNDLSNLVSAINGVSGTTGITATFTSSTAKNSITLSTTDGRNIELRDYANGGGAGATMSFDGTTLTEAATVSAIKTGTIALTSSKGAISTANANTEVFLAATNNSTFSSLAAVDISTAAGATSALSVVDAALSQINGGRADLGAVQNRFSSTIANLQTISENLSASRSRIQDADFAQETAALSRAQVLQQAATAMVAQANQLPQLVLQLLKG